MKITLKLFVASLGLFVVAAHAVQSYQMNDLTQAYAQQDWKKFIEIYDSLNVDGAIDKKNKAYPRYYQEAKTGLNKLVEQNNTSFEEKAFLQKQAMINQGILETELNNNDAGTIDWNLLESNNNFVEYFASQAEGYSDNINWSEAKLPEVKTEVASASWFPKKTVAVLALTAAIFALYKNKDKPAVQKVLNYFNYILNYIKGFASSIKSGNKLAVEEISKDMNATKATNFFKNFGYYISGSGK